MTKRNNQNENINNKIDLVNHYLDNYPNEFKLPFCELILSKIDNENHNSLIRLSDNQRTTVMNIISDEFKDNNQKFEECLECLTFDQIEYIGW
tara:strand:+ start:281 stop:559 length:279 start_codon:yes stop_codon:yes gene_type:complete